MGRDKGCAPDARPPSPRYAKAAGGYARTRTAGDNNGPEVRVSLLLILLIVLLVLAAAGGGIFVSNLLWLLLVIALVVLLVGLFSGRRAV